MLWAYQDKVFQNSVVYINIYYHSVIIVITCHSLALLRPLQGRRPQLSERAAYLFSPFHSSTYLREKQRINIRTICAYFYSIT